MHRRHVISLALGAAILLAAGALPAAAQPRGERGERGEPPGRGGPNRTEHDDRQRWYGVPLPNGPILTDQQRRALLQRQLPPPQRPRGPPPRGRD
jgi:hypothetical protein